MNSKKINGITPEMEKGDYFMGRKLVAWFCKCKDPTYQENLKSLIGALSCR